MEIRIDVPDVAHAKGLVQRLVGVLDASTIALDADSPAVLVQATQEKVTLPQLLHHVGTWLDEAAVDAAAIWLDGRLHTLSREDMRIVVYR